MAKYKVYLLSFVAVFIVISAPLAVLTWGHLQGNALYDQCMTWEGATEQECAGYLD